MFRNMLLVPVLIVGLVPSTLAAPEAKQRARTDRYGDPLPDGAVARLGTISFRHPFWVGGLAFLPDGKTLASACWDGRVRFWDVDSGRETRSFRAASKPAPNRGPTAFLGVAISPDGKTVFAVGNHEFVHIWDLKTGKERQRLRGENGFGFALSPDGKRLAVGQGGGKRERQFILWDLPEGKLSRTRGAAKRAVDALAFSPDSKMLAVGDCAALGAMGAEDGTSSVRLWDAEATQVLRELKGHTGSVTAVAFASDGRTLVSASSDATLRFWDPATGKQVRTIQVPDDTAPIEGPGMQKNINYGGVLTVAFSPDGRLLASGSYDGSVRLWDAGSGKQLHVLRGHGREVANVLFSPNGKILASGSRDNSIRLWDVKSGEPLRPRQGHDGPVNNLAVSPDGGTAAAVCHDHTVRLWSLATGRQLHVLRGHTDFIYTAAFSPDGRAIATGSADRTVRLWDVATGRELRRLGGHRGAVYTLAFVAGRKTLVSGAANDGTLHFWDWTTGETLHQVPVVPTIDLLQCSSDGQVLAAGDRSGVRLLDVKTGKERRHFGNSSLSFALSTDGRMLATLRPDERKIRFWNSTSGEEIGVLADQQFYPGFAGVPPFALSPDGRVLARTGKDGAIELWEVLTRKLRRRFRGHSGSIGPIVFAPDGKSLLSGSDDTTVLVWDVARQRDERSERLSEAALQAAWRDLGEDDAEKADRALCTLAARAEDSLPFLQAHLHPAKIADEERLLRLIADLDSEKFAVRERAERELQKLGERAAASLRQALTKSPSLETRRRIERLLEPLRGKAPTAELRRALRAVEALERLATVDARKLLKTLAEGAAEDRLTHAAKASLQRLAKSH